MLTETVLGGIHEACQDTRHVLRAKHATRAYLDVKEKYLVMKCMILPGYEVHDTFPSQAEFENRASCLLKRKAAGPCGIDNSYSQLSD
ncbi:unnamed protein product [Thelazia callipaeda]|uniref:DRBM domain-containing protein n=1 Tax=Thelazia callipaeda TaxID=103827 RepID=A0A0N5CM73_THECL|nr:unnamed protein product [Thelazia callipaeda]